MPSSAPPVQPNGFQSPSGKTLLWVAVLLLLWFARYVFMLVFAGVLLAIFLYTLSSWLAKRFSIGYGWCLGFVVTVLALSLGGLLALFGTRIAQEAVQLSESLPQSIERVQQRIQETEWGNALLNNAPSMAEILNNKDMWSQVGGAAATTLNAFIALIVVGFIGLFCAADPEVYRNGTLALFPRTRRRDAALLLDELGHNLRWWLLGHLVTMSIVGVLIGIGLTVLGVPQPFALAFLAFVAELVPNFGPILASIPAILLAWSQSTSLAIYVVILYSLVQLFESYLILPLVQRQMISLPPALTIIAVVLFGLMGGVLGAIVATPLMLTLYVVVKAIIVDGKLRPKQPKLRPAKSTQPV